MKSSSVTIATMWPSCTTGRHPMRCRRMSAMASTVSVSGVTVRSSRRMMSATRDARRAPGRVSAPSQLSRDFASAAKCRSTARDVTRPTSLPVRVLDGDVADALPAHEVGDELDGVVGLHGEEVGLHVLRDLVVAGARAVDLVEARALPLDDGAPGLLARDRRGDERVEALARRAARLHARERAEHPARAGAQRAHALVDDAEVLLDVRVVDARRARGPPRRAAAAGRGRTAAR